MVGMMVRVRSWLPALLWLAVLAMTCWVYWPGLDGPSIFDDGSNLRVLEILEDNPQNVRDVVFGNKSGPLGRPLSMLSFSLEKLYFDDGVRGEKRTNLFIHLLCGSLVTILFILLLNYIGNPAAVGLAIALSAIWMLSPLFVSTVLYSVQRMAQLSTLFMLASLIVYVIWRIRWLRGGSSWYLPPIVLVLVAMAILSKENGIVALPILVLLEMLWFQFRDREGSAHTLFKRISLSLCGVAIFSVIIFQLLYPEWVASGYKVRPFTLTERALTEGRILWDYIFQIFLPDVSRMGAYHDDIVLSTSLSSPGTTRTAWLAWGFVAIAIGACCFSRYGRYLAFAMLLFLVGHAVESSVFALELYFEHRNYFPSVGLLLLLGVVLGKVLRVLPELKNIVLFGLASFALLISLKTSSQVHIWSSDPLLRMTSVNAHPQSYRANINMAVLLARYGALEEAWEFSRRASLLTAERTGDIGVRSMLLNCYANAPISSTSLDGLELWSAQGRIISGTNALHYLVRKLQNGECPAVDSMAIADKFSALLLGDPAQAEVTAEVYAGLAVLENSLQRYQKAYDYTNLFLSLSSGNARGLLMKLHFATALGKTDSTDLARSKLLMLEDSGLLTLSEQQTLSLYSEN